MSDAPDGPLETRGGMEAGNPGLDGASETGRSGVGHPQTDDATDDTSNQRLVGEQATDGEGL
jgi:hypothetical protein